MMVLWNWYEVEEIMGVLKIDLKNGCNSTKRSQMLAQVESKVPHLLRFTSYLYAQSAKFVVMHRAAVVGEIDSIHGSQQGDRLTGCFFALSIYDSMVKLKDTFPEAGNSWIVDVLTVSAKQGRLLGLSAMVHTQGPEHGLFSHNTKGEFYSQMGLVDSQWKPLRNITHRNRYTQAQWRFKRLLGAQFGDEAYEAEAAVTVSEGLMVPVRHLKGIQDT